MAGNRCEVFGSGSGTRESCGRDGKSRPEWLHNRVGVGFKRTIDGRRSVKMCLERTSHVSFNLNVLHDPRLTAPGCRGCVFTRRNVRNEVD